MSVTNMMVMSIIELPALEMSGGSFAMDLRTGSNQVRVLQRDLVGKSCWDVSPLNRSVVDAVHDGGNGKTRLETEDHRCGISVIVCFVFRRRRSAVVGNWWIWWRRPQKQRSYRVDGRNVQSDLPSDAAQHAPPGSGCFADVREFFGRSWQFRRRTRVPTSPCRLISHLDLNSYFLFFFCFCYFLQLLQYIGHTSSECLEDMEILLNNAKVKSPLTPQLETDIMSSILGQLFMDNNYTEKSSAVHYSRYVIQSHDVESLCYTYVYF